MVYPKFETMGSFSLAVQRVRAWLTEQVAAASDNGGTIRPVWVVMCGHSMGGLVAADVLLQSLDAEENGDVSLGKHCLLGVLGYDSPFLGVSPSVFSGQIWKHGRLAYRTAQSLELGSTFELSRRLGSRWGAMWGVTAGVAGILTAGAMAYRLRSNISSGVRWVSAHEEFVKVLFQESDLHTRVQRIARLSRFHCFYTKVGASIVRGQYFIIPPEPHSELEKYFEACENTHAHDEIEAHIGMFDPDTNTSYFSIQDRTLQLIESWVAEAMDNEKHNMDNAQEENMDNAKEDMHDTTFRARRSRRKRRVRSNYEDDEYVD